MSPTLVIVETVIEFNDIVLQRCAERSAVRLYQRDSGATMSLIRKTLFLCELFPSDSPHPGFFFFFPITPSETPSAERSGFWPVCVS